MKKPSTSGSSSSSTGYGPTAHTHGSTSGANTRQQQQHSSSSSTSSNNTGALGTLDPWSTNAGVEGGGVVGIEEGDRLEMTVEQFLEQQCQTIIDDIRKHAVALTKQLQREHETGVQQIQHIIRENLHPTVTSTCIGVIEKGAPVSQIQAVSTATATATATTAADSHRISVTLKCVSGPHIGQKFRLETPENKIEDTFKIGRSTSKLFKEKGLSLYKDKEVSTAHGKIDLRHGAAFYLDTKSTNGTAINGKMIESQQPVRLKDGDVLSIGGTELNVHVSVNVMSTIQHVNENGEVSVGGTENPQVAENGVAEDENFASV